MAQVNFRIDDTLKNDVEALYNRLGLTLSAAFTLFAHQSLLHHGLPFVVREQDTSAVSIGDDRSQVMYELAACSQYARDHEERLTGEQVFGGIRERLHAGRRLLSN